MLRQVFDSVQNAGADQPDFYDALKAAAFGQLCITKSGRLLEISSGNGHMSKFALPETQTGLTPVAVTELFEEFLTRYDDAVAELGGQPTDEQIFQQMMLYLRSITGFTPNWMYLAK
ncbi:MAG: hypothetical protein JWQ04_2779 [Pedosphaera sp.]|nr:hypothetical protein [Pedosphaera sp.]